MAELPDVTDLTASDVTESEFAMALGDMYAYLAQLLTGSSVESLEIVLGQIEPTKTFIIVDTENATSTDDLDGIAPTDIGEKIIILKILSNARVVTLRHMEGGSGELYLAGEADLLLDHKNCMIAFRYNVAETRWDELWRNFGVFAPTTTAQAAARTALGLGAAATKATGTGSPGNVPLISDLGALAFLGALNDASQIGDGIVTNAKLAGGITWSKMANSTPNSIPSYNASGVPALVTPSVNNTFLKYNGTNLEFYTPDDTGLTSVGQSELRNSSGSVSVSSSGGNLILPGGNFGMYPATRVTSGYLSAQICNRVVSAVSFATRIHLASYSEGAPGSGGGGTCYAQQYWITASPPYDIGDGEATGFVYFLMEGNNVIATYVSDTPPWIYNGNSPSTAELVDMETGKKYIKRRQRVIDGIRTHKNFKPQAMGFRDLLDSSMADDRALAKELSKVRAELGRETFNIVRSKIEGDFKRKKKNEILEKHFELITPKIQNADMGVIPHPFEVKPGQRVYMAATNSDLVGKLVYAQTVEKEDISEAIMNGYFVPDVEIKGAAPNGVQLIKMKVK